MMPGTMPAAGEPRTAASTALMLVQASSRRAGSTSVYPSTPESRARCAISMCRRSYACAVSVPSSSMTAQPSLVLTRAAAGPSFHVFSMVSA
jgi:hypothetical protein